MERTIISFDYAIKGILRDKANFDILSGFLTELLEKPVTVQDVLESEGKSNIRVVHSRDVACYVSTNVTNTTNCHLLRACSQEYVVHAGYTKRT